jgi:hypothetical protein
MPTPPTPYEIVLRGRASARLLRPVLDDFSVDHTVDGFTRLVGDIADAAHLHGVVSHLTSVSVELISVAPIPPLPGGGPEAASYPGHPIPSTTTEMNS